MRTRTARNHNPHSAALRAAGGDIAWKNGLPRA